MTAIFDACLANQARETPIAIALEDDTGTLTFAEVEAQVSRMSARIAALGLGVEPRIVLIAENSTVHLVTAFAVWRSGATLVTVYPSSTASEIEYAFSHSHPALVITGESVLATVEPVARGLGLPLLTLTDDGAVADPPDGFGDAPSIDPDGLALICYTSGSTARPKAVMHSHRGLLRRGRSPTPRSGTSGLPTSISSRCRWPGRSGS